MRGPWLSPPLSVPSSESSTTSWMSSSVPKDSAPPESRVFSLWELLWNRSNIDALFLRLSRPLSFCVAHLKRFVTVGTVSPWVWSWGVIVEGIYRAIARSHRQASRYPTLCTYRARWIYTSVVEIAGEIALRSREKAQLRFLSSTEGVEERSLSLISEEAAWQEQRVSRFKMEIGSNAHLVKSSDRVQK